MVIARVMLAGAIIGGVVFAGPRDAAATGGSVVEVAAAPAAVDVGGLTFSDAVNEAAEPVNPRVEFSAGVNEVWVSFDYRNNDPQTRLSYIVRANGEDFRDGELGCCTNRDGRFAFAIERRRGGDVGGAAFEVFIFAGDTELGRGGFGIRGIERFDNDNRADNESDDNDND